MSKITIESVIYQYPKRESHSTQRSKSVNSEARSKALKWWASGAVFGLLGALVFPLITGLVVHLALGASTRNSLLQMLSTISSVEIIPLLIFGGVCLAQAMKLTTPKPYGSSARQLPNTTKGCRSVVIMLLTISLFLCLTVQATAQTPTDRSVNMERPVMPAAITSASSREALLIDRIEKLERRLAELEAKLNAKAPSSVETVAYIAVEPEPGTLVNTDKNTGRDLQFLSDTTFNVTFDGYYGYNFNRPVGGVNLLRAYDVMSNSFSLNQAAVVIENAPNLEKGKRHGFRLDLQYGQATETVQGNAGNEPRPPAYRNLWQAYGTYVLDVGKGLTVDFGKWAGSLGYETNYTKDNFNYSRSYYFNFLPFYHFGFRTKYPINDKVTLMYHLVNGVQQSEDFNGFKSHHVALILSPSKRVSGQINYYFGREQRDRNPVLNPTLAMLPTQAGLSTDVIRPVPSGRLHVLDTYYTFAVNDNWTFAVEGDYVVGRVFPESAPATVWGGTGYAGYQWTPKFALRGRLEYLAERVSAAAGLFSGVTQALKEGTLTAEYKLADGFLLRGEYRRDWSNQPFFLTETPGVLKKEQNTATIGLVWWLGQKQGTW